MRTTCIILYFKLHTIVYATAEAPRLAHNTVVYTKTDIAFFNVGFLDNIHRLLCFTYWTWKLTCDISCTISSKWREDDFNGFCFDTDQVFESLPSSPKTNVAFRFHSLILAAILNQNIFTTSVEYWLVQWNFLLSYFSSLSLLANCYQSRKARVWSKVASQATQAQCAW